MGLEFEKIERLERIRREKSVLSDEESALASPVLKDKSLVREIYGMFVEILNERGRPPDPAVTQRKKFLFIILYLFSPSTLAGGKMASGLRDEISRAMGMKSADVISKNREDVVFLYRHYMDFREDIRHIYSEIMDRLKARGLVK